MLRSIVVVAVLLVLSLVLVGVPGLFVSPTTSEVAPETHQNQNAEVVTPGDADSGFWPYLNSRRKFERRSPVNVVVIGDTETVARVLVADSGTNWEETTSDKEEADPNTHSLEVEVDDNITNDSNNTTNGSNNTTNDTLDTTDSTATDDSRNTTTTESDSDNPSDTTTETDPDTTSGTDPDDSSDNTTDTDSTDSDSTDSDSGDGTDSNAATPTDTTTTDSDNNVTNDSSNESINVGATTITWTRTTGATRYAYVLEGNGGDGRWVTETAQLHDGTYYGHRYHIRMYESPNPDEPWVIMQTHGEHFDWFTLRHRVDGSQKAQMRLEADLMATPQVDVREDVSRRYLGNSNSKDADGWATVVDLEGTTITEPRGPVFAIFLLAGTFVTNVVTRTQRRLDDHLTETDRRRLAAVTERADPRHLLLAGMIVGVILGVRVGGIALERTGLLSMHAIAALLYPFIGFGLPVGTYLLASGLERRLDAAVVASGSLAVAIWLDYGVLGVSTLPIDVILQRMLVVLALGLIAGGATRRANRDARWNGLLLFGAGVWVLLLAATLFGYL